MLSALWSKEGSVQSLDQNRLQQRQGTGWRGWGVHGRTELGVNTITLSGSRKLSDSCLQTPIFFFFFLLRLRKLATLIELKNLYNCQIYIFSNFLSPVNQVSFIYSVASRTSQRRKQFQEYSFKRGSKFQQDNKYKFPPIIRSRRSELRRRRISAAS